MIVQLHVEKGIHMGATYRFLIGFKNDFLESRPTVTCLSDIWHPNIRQDSEVCCNLLADDWRDGTTLEGIIAVLYCLFENPNFASALNPDVLEDGYAETVARLVQ